MKVEVNQGVPLKTLEPGSTFRQRCDPSHALHGDTVYLVLDDGPRKQHEDIPICILNTGTVLRWPTQTPVVPISTKLVEDLYA